jgi:hypothetical protein
VLIAAALIAHSLWFNFVNDDAYISFVYSRNLAEHGELTFNVGERVEGYTNFLWTVLLAAAYLLGAAPDVASRVLGTLFGVLGLVVVARLMARVRGRESVWDVLPAALLAASSGYACWCSGGLETQLFTFTAILGIERHLAGRPIASGVAFALCTMTRPEGALLFGLTVIHQLVQNLAGERRIWPSRREWWWAAAYLGLYVPYFVWRYRYYGDLLPNTAYVKTGGAPPPGYAAQMHAQGAYYVWQWASQSKAVWAAPLVLVGLWKHPRVVSLVVVVIAVYLVYAWRVGGDFMGLHRFVMPLFPLTAVAAALGLAALCERRRQGLALAPLVLVPFVWSQVSLSARSMIATADSGIDRPGYLKQYADDRAKIGKVLAPLLGPSDFSWVGGVGVQPYYARMRAHDVFGLVSRKVAHEVPPSRPRPGHQKWAPPELVLAEDPTFIFYCYMIHGDPERYSLCGEAGIFRARGYEPCTIHVPGMKGGGEYYTFLKKKERVFPCRQSLGG